MTQFSPYGLVIPPEYNNTGQQQRRLDIWFHGRGEKVSEIHFLTQQRKSTGQYTPPNSFVLHPYGRYCNAFKFAGEVDVFESLEHVKARVPVDPTDQCAWFFNGRCRLLAICHSLS